MNTLIPPVYAAVTPTPTALGDLCGEGLGPFAQFLCGLDISKDAETNAAYAFGSFAFLLSNVIAIMTVVGGLWFIFQFILAGYKWMSSGGDKGKLQEAQNQMMHAVIGLVIVMSAFALISLVSAIIGVDLLLTKPGEFVNKIAPRL